MFDELLGTERGLEPCPKCGEDRPPHPANAVHQLGGVRCGCTSGNPNNVLWHHTSKVKHRRKNGAELLALLPEHQRLRCEFCLMTAGQLLMDGKQRVIEGHHVVEVQEGGTDDPENIRAYCTDCHRLCHTMRDRTRRADHT